MANLAYQVHFTKRGERDFKKLLPIIRNKILPSVQKLKINPHPVQSKRLVHHQSAQYRLRVGDYRILYDVYANDKTVLILRLGHRKDIYR